mmetsp:Transcript_29772/g.98757  ORF Transcript_29772/g.98757 Transcript_29772/m.98757 type:complete len:227 (+) Transcript_29772:704-1384(+)
MTSRMIAWNESPISTWIRVNISLSKPSRSDNISSNLSASLGSELWARSFCKGSTTNARPNIANPYVMKKITTTVQNRVRAESASPRISVHASSNQGISRKIRTMRARRNALSTWSTRRKLSPPMSMPTRMLINGMIHSTNTPATMTKTASKKFILFSSLVGTKILHPNTHMRNSNSAVKRAVKTCSETSKKSQSPRSSPATKRCACKPMVQQLSRMMLIQTISNSQ